jgi:hypothetical protein
MAPYDVTSNIRQAPVTGFCDSACESQARRQHARVCVPNPSGTKAKRNKLLTFKVEGLTLVHC